MKKNICKEEVNIKLLDTRAVFWVYVIFQGLIFLTAAFSLILAIINPDGRDNRIGHIFLCGVALIFFNMPALFKKKGIYIPSVFQIVALIFIFAHFIMGEILRFYDYSMLLDKLLHTTSGLGFSALGFSLVNLLNKSKNNYLRLSPFFVAIFAFSFSMAIAGVWEIFEFVMDSLLGTNMQRWQDTQHYTAALAGRTGLMDTMGDIIVCTVGSAVISIVGYMSLKSKSDFLNHVMIRRFTDYDSAIEEVAATNDAKLLSALITAREAQQSQTSEQCNIELPEDDFNDIEVTI